MSDKRIDIKYLSEEHETKGGMSRRAGAIKRSGCLGKTFTVYSGDTEKCSGRFLYGTLKHGDNRIGDTGYYIINSGNRTQIPLIQIGSIDMINRRIQI